MTSRQLLWQRLKQHWKGQYGVLKSVIDWTVFVYFVIPATVISFFVYKSWWTEIPSWMDGIPVGILFLIFFFLLWGDHFLTFVREADRIFLKRNEKLFLGLKRGGIIYSYLFECLSAAGLCLAIAPFWFRHFDLNIIQLLLFACLWVSLKWLIMGIKGKVDVMIRGWRSFLRGIPIFLGALLIWQFSYRFFIDQAYLLCVALIFFNSFISIALVRPRFTSVYNFERDLAIDQLEKSKWTETIFRISMDIEKIPISYSNRKSPRLYSRSNQIFKKRTPKNGFLELFIKVITRDKQYMLSYFQIIGWTSAAAFFLPPIWLKVAVVGSGCIFLLSWIGNVWHKVIASPPFTRKYASEDAFFVGKRSVTAVAVIPFLLIVGLITYIRIYIFNQL